MNKMLALLPLLLAAALSAQAPYEFKEVKRLDATPVKDQGQTGTCWSFSTTSFLESEALRQGKGTTDLSEMFGVRHIYRQKAHNYVRRQGTAQLDQGGLAHDLLNAVRDYGIVPESAYPGRPNAASSLPCPPYCNDDKANQPHNHTALVGQLQSLCAELVAQGKAGTLSANWPNRVDSLLDAHLGKPPLTFVVNGTQFTPTSYRDFLGINPDDYVHLTSFTHHPFYAPFILEVPDNFANGSFFNLPLSDLMRTLNYALQQGYTVEWDADVSNNGFSPKHSLAIVPEKTWKDKSTAEREQTFVQWEDEKDVSPAYRQELFDRQVTMDDHLMHITGILDETNSGIYYLVKNSWGTPNGADGYVRVSEAYMRLNTISLTIHKNALPKDVRQRMGLEPGQPAIEQVRPVDNRSADPGQKPTAPQTTEQKIRTINTAPTPKAAPAKAGSKQ